MGVPAGTGQGDVCCVVDERVRGNQAFIQRRSVAGKRFDGGTGGTCSAAVIDAAVGDRNGTVQPEVDFLFADAAAEREDAAVIRIHHHDGALELLLIPAALRHRIGVGV